jgi:pyrroline-5-carboxylate reductase
MGEAMVGAIIRSNLFSPTSIRVSDINEERLVFLSRTYGVNTTKNNFEVFSESDIVIFAIKPQQMNEVLSDITSQEGYKIQHRKLAISIVAGVPLRKIEAFLYSPLDENLRKKLPVIRVMPNTPALVLAGISGMSPNPNSSAEDIQVARTILERMGSVIQFKESDLDAVTALSGTGPAYVFYLIESMIKGGINLGLDPDEAATLSITTLKGAVKLLEQRKETPEALRRKVTSPGGTTEAAFEVMQQFQVKQRIVEAIAAAAQRSKALGQ